MPPLSFKPHPGLLCPSSSSSSQALELEELRREEEKKDFLDGEVKEFMCFAIPPPALPVMLTGEGEKLKIVSPDLSLSSRWSMKWNTQECVSQDTPRTRALQPRADEASGARHTRAEDPSRTRHARADEADTGPSFRVVDDRGYVIGRTRHPEKAHPSVLRSSFGRPLHAHGPAPDGADARPDGAQHAVAPVGRLGQVVPRCVDLCWFVAPSSCRHPLPLFPPLVLPYTQHTHTQPLLHISTHGCPSRP